MPDLILVLTTLPADHDTAEFARRLVDERLAACVSVSGEMTSTYRWDGRLTQDRERQVLIKTVSSRLPALMDRIRSIHPYEVPEALVVSVAGGFEPYLRWVVESTI